MVFRSGGGTECLPLTGGAMKDNIDMQYHRITHLADPLAITDAANAVSVNAKGITSHMVTQIGKSTAARLVHDSETTEIDAELTMTAILYNLDCRSSETIKKILIAKRSVWFKERALVQSGHTTLEFDMEYIDGISDTDLGHFLIFTDFKTVTSATGGSAVYNDNSWRIGTSTTTTPQTLSYSINTQRNSYLWSLDEVFI